MQALHSRANDLLTFTSWELYYYQNELWSHVEFNLWSDCVAFQEQRWGVIHALLLCTLEWSKRAAYYERLDGVVDIRGMAVIHRCVFTWRRTLFAQMFRGSTDVWHYWAAQSPMNWGVLLQRVSLICINPSVPAHGERVMSVCDIHVNLQLFKGNVAVSCQENIILSTQSETCWACLKM